MSDNDVLTRLELSRKELLDLGMRNPLINHRLRSKQIRIVDELSIEIFRILVTENQPMSFLPVSEDIHSESESENGNGQLDFLQDDERSALRQPENKQPAARHTDTFLQTELTAEKLQTRLLSIHNDARTYLEEQGVNILFLALGFLHWYETPQQPEARRAPLVLIPVDISRTRADEQFTLAYSGDEIEDNLSLIEKLKADFGLQIPMLEDEETPDTAAYFDAIATAIQRQDRWQVKKNEIALGFFSFGKFLMYKDLDPAAWPPGSGPGVHPILSAILSNGFQEKRSEHPDDTFLDAVISPQDLSLVKDADSSQILAMLDAKAGRNLVVQGPPGTGKSQTITNIIAESMATRKKVLFVSEKMAALNVVKRRLDEVGIGSAVLELHSHKTKKKRLLEDLKECIDLQYTSSTNGGIEEIDFLEQCRNRLNAYCAAVNTPIGNTRTNFVNAIGKAIQARTVEGIDSIFDSQVMTNWTEADFREFRMLMQVLDSFVAENGPPYRNPFALSGLSEYHPSREKQLTQELQKAVKYTAKLIELGAWLAKVFGADPPEKLSELKALWQSGKRITEAPDLGSIKLSSPVWSEQGDKIIELIGAGKNHRKLRQNFQTILLEQAWDADVLTIRQNFLHTGKKWWRHFSKDYRTARTQFQGLCRQTAPQDPAEVVRIIDAILDDQCCRKTISANQTFGQEIFGRRWQDLNTDWASLEVTSNWLIDLFADIGNQILPAGIGQSLEKILALEQLPKLLEQIYQYLQKHDKYISHIAETLQLQVAESSGADWPMSLKQQAKLLYKMYQSPQKLSAQVKFNQIKKKLIDKGFQTSVEKIAGWSGAKGSLLGSLDYCWYLGLVEKAYREIPEINLFDKTEHEFNIDEFRRLDRLLLQHHQLQLAQQHRESLRDFDHSAGFQIVSREINKKRRHLPIRKLIDQAGQAIQLIKPIFMMSPMSIAKFLPAAALEFDLVIFDEASQVKPVDAFGAILRGKQVLVVGDSQQLPPTNFFESLTMPQTGDDMESVGDLESILGLMLAQGAPQRMLRWHYRSRNQSLIAVSNYEFYDNKLLVFPSPGINPKARGLRLLHSPETSYDRGKTRVNHQEAQIVAQAVYQHFKDHPDLSLGVVAFSQAQREAIEIQLEIMRRNDSRYEHLFQQNELEPFFVKNLENVQGDERDVIFISLGYGKTAEGYMTMNFGPLNREGGERRLNVLISRARMAMDVFSNFTAADIDLNRSNARGVVALKNFLAYAATGILEQPYSTNAEPDSPFEEAVISELQKRGYKTEAQVGVAGFFIDIAVVDPNKPGRYILGIECDGASYHSSQSARDRDRLRQEILEGLGWTIYRIWSTAWFTNPDAEIDKTIAAIEKAQLFSGTINSTPAGDGVSATQQPPTK